MIVKSSILRDHLRAALICAADKDIRYYMNGVLIEFYPDRTFIVATDGHRLACLRDETNPAGAQVPYSGVAFTMPRTMAANIKAKGRFDPAFLLGVEYDTETQAVTLRDGDSTYTGKAVEGKFPDWRSTMQAANEGDGQAAGQFNTDYIADFGKTAKVLGKLTTSVRIWHDGQKRAALVTVYGRPDFVGVVMPMYQNEDARPDVIAFSAAPDAPTEAKLAA